MAQFRHLTTARNNDAHKALKSREEEPCPAHDTPCCRGLADLRSALRIPCKWRHHGFPRAGMRRLRWGRQVVSRTSPLSMPTTPHTREGPTRALDAMRTGELASSTLEQPRRESGDGGIAVSRDVHAIRCTGRWGEKHARGQQSRRQTRPDQIAEPELACCESHYIILSF